MRRGGGPIAAVGASLALLVAVPLIAVARRGRGSGSRPPATRAALVVVDPVEASDDAPRRDGLRGDPVAAAGGCRPGRRAVRPAARVQQRPRAATGSSTSSTSRRAAPAAHVSTRSEDVEPAWSPDGSQLVWASGAERRSRPPPRPHRPSARGAAHARARRRREPAWAPNGRRIAFASDAQGAFDLWSVARAGRQARARPRRPRGGTLARLAPLGRPPRLHGPRRRRRRRLARRPRRAVASRLTTSPGTTAGPTGRRTAARSHSSASVEARSSRGSSGRPAGPRHGSSGCRAEHAK